MKSHKDLTVWQKSIDLVVQVYHLTAQLPAKEHFNLCSQSERAVVSIPSNIAEGARRRHKAEFLHFLSIAEGSAGELETHLIVITKLYPNLEKEAENCLLVVEEIMKMLYALVQSLSKK